MSASDDRTDTIAHSNLTEQLYLHAAPCVHAVFKCMLDALQERCDGEQAIRRALSYSISKCSSWNATQIKQVAASWSKDAGDIVRAARALAALESRIMQQKSVTHGEVSITTSFPEVFHALLVASARPLENNIESIMNDSENSTETILRHHKCFESAVSRLMHDGVMSAIDTPVAAAEAPEAATHADEFDESPRRVKSTSRDSEEEDEEEEGEEIVSGEEEETGDEFVEEDAEEYTDEEEEVVAPAPVVKEVPEVKRIDLRADDEEEEGDDPAVAQYVQNVIDMV